jgi:hypothetical protein
MCTYVHTHSDVEEQGLSEQVAPQGAARSRRFIRHRLVAALAAQEGCAGCDMPPQGSPA